MNRRLALKVLSFLLPAQSVAQSYGKSKIVIGTVEPNTTLSLEFSDSVKVLEIRIGGKKFRIPVHEIIEALEPPKLTTPAEDEDPGSGPHQTIIPTYDRFRNFVRFAWVDKDNG